MRHGLTPKPRSRRILVEVGAVEDLEDEAEALLELGLPLLEHRRRRGDDDRLGLLAQQQLARDQARLDRLAEAGVVGDEEVDARQAQRLAQRLHLVGVDLDAGAERRLEEVRVGGGDAVPAERVEEGRELARSVEALRREVLPALFLEDPPVELVVPEDLERLALGVVVGARQADQGRLAGNRWRLDVLDQPRPGTDLDQLALLGHALW